MREQHVPDGQMRELIESSLTVVRLHPETATDKDYTLASTGLIISELRMLPKAIAAEVWALVGQNNPHSKRPIIGTKTGVMTLVAAATVVLLELARILGYVG